MAKLKGILKIEGTLDELTFYKTQEPKAVYLLTVLQMTQTFNVPVKTVVNLEALQLLVKCYAMQFVI
jgi:hypothetical protein